MMSNRQLLIKAVLQVNRTRIFKRYYAEGKGAGANPEDIMVQVGKELQDLKKQLAIVEQIRKREQQTPKVEPSKWDFINKHYQDIVGGLAIFFGLSASYNYMKLRDSTDIIIKEKNEEIERLKQQISGNSQDITQPINTPTSTSTNQNKDKVKLI